MVEIRGLGLTNASSINRSRQDHENPAGRVSGRGLSRKSFWREPWTDVFPPSLPSLLSLPDRVPCSVCSPGAFSFIPRIAPEPSLATAQATSACRISAGL